MVNGDEGNLKGDGDNRHVHMVRVTDRHARIVMVTADSYGDCKYIRKVSY